ncbi:probably inactive receptor-like protein kinase At5g41680 isoform X2 [Nicotiana tabacum]|uniref:Probably inactive receptor-like protein kinase At5g41680 isoform X2 n=2 Tax=Nicotiana tabacum TaxID=4097 RepID=A0A1S4AC79_TOBAC|nr:PREDICTED: probable leucine-rich repeat receptor-like protein kinase At1g68400 isoform X2 [Nicotiana tabacum]
MVPLNPKNHFSLSKFLSFSLFISIFFTISHSDDFSSLLTFKSKVDTSNFLISWSKNNDPCSSWLGVTCHPMTRRVIKLVLNHLNLTGSVHPLIHLTQIRHLSLHNNFLTSFPNFNSWPNLKHVYLSHNNFSGEFPPEIYRLKRLRRLDLSYNKFSGEIPVTELNQLPHLMTLQLEFNSFSGSLGMDETRHVASFKDFNVSGNNFSGKIPNWLSKFPVASFTGCKGFSKVEDLLKASAEILGKGSVGTSYKVAMDCKDVVVVKRVIEKLKKMKDLDGFLRLIGGLRHQNVVSLRAYYSSKEELLLVYDFLPNGSLHNLLHGNRGPGRTPLDWSTRLKYALGAAKGLASLHSYNKTKIYHGNFTSSNILIDHFGNACISDICLHLLLQMPISSNNGYKAPELSTQNNMNTNQNPRKLSQKCDVYSFGVVLLEILTGKIATSEGETSLTKWVQRVVNKEWTWDVFDFELARYKEMEDEMVALLKVAMACLVSSPKDRPKMIVVEKMIEEIRKTENR